MTAAALQNETIWLRHDGFRVMALNPKLAARASELKKALNSGLPAYPDTNRPDFYDVELPTGWAYIHVREDRQAVYLVAYSRV